MQATTHYRLASLFLRALRRAAVLRVGRNNVISVRYFILFMSDDIA